MEQLSKGIRNKINAELEMLHLSRTLAEIHCEVPLTLSLSDCMLNINYPKAEAMLEKLELEKLKKDIALKLVK